MDAIPPTSAKAAQASTPLSANITAMNQATTRSRDRRNLALGLAFLGPNILGFLLFTALPLLFSMILAFTNWDLKLHNALRAAELANTGQPPEHIQFVGLSNFIRLFQMDDFWRYLGNTLFFMMAMPFAIAASLGSAILLSKDLRGGSRRVWLGLFAGAILVGSSLILVSVGAGATGMTLLIGGMAAGMLIFGTLGGTTVYRTLFYVPNFTSGVATYLLWKKLYNPTSGPIAVALTPPLQSLTHAINATPAWLWQSGLVVCLGLVAWITVRATRRLRLFWEDGDVGWGGAMVSCLFLAVPMLCILGWYGVLDAGTNFGSAGLPLAGAVVVLIGIATLLWNVRKAMQADRTYLAKAMTGVGSGLMLGAVAMIAQLVLIGLAAVLWNLPEWATLDPGNKLYGLTTPKWLNDMNWAKPSIMMMGFWGAIGSNTMLLYLAALTNVPQDLYEAADIDGAGRFQKFWHVTWPQLAPTTFFVVVMGVIGGLQGGFEMARVMTKGGPAGSTTTLAYYIYTEGFETGRLGFSSAVAWTLFLLVLLVTLFNWRFGNKYVND